MAMTERINKLVEENAALSARLANGLKDFNLDFLIWASPSSCRSPEETKLWHPIYGKKSIIVKMAIYFYIIVLYSTIGIVRFFTYRGFFYNWLKRGSPVLLVIPDEITDHSARIRTNYLLEDANYPIDKLVFSRIKNIGFNAYNLSYLNRAKIFMKLFWVLLFDLAERLYRKEINFEYLDSFVVFLRWIISQAWCFHWDFYHFLKKFATAGSSNYRVLLSLHEMHFYSKVIWKLAREEGIMGVTAQHAMIIPEKLWYFPHKLETKANCPMPDVFFVYSDEIRQLLRPFYPQTRFELCCSPRFKKWKASEADLAKSQTTKDKQFVTFVSGIMSYDVTILVQAIKNLLRKNLNGGLKIKLRLHPYVNITSKDRSWIKTASAFKKIEISNVSLKDDLSMAKLIIGSNSTVLHEAVLLGLPVLSVFNHDFVHPTILPDTADWNVSIDGLTWERIGEQTTKRPDKELINRFRANMGMFSPDITSGLIYETCHLLNFQNDRE